ncbi:MAG: DUF4956 domain-containing protein [Clostridiales bacterium]|nr:DUF4956 domain-containing protein [Clostridiales bacterium]
MLNTLFASVFGSGSSEIVISEFLVCVLAALVVGAISALIYTYKNEYTKGFVVSLALLPAAVAVVIMMVNGNLGTGVAVAGAFSLVRFRSAPGTAKEIYAIFVAMTAGLAMGMGYIGYGVLFTLIAGAASLIYNATKFGEPKENMCDKVLQVTIPENLDYSGVFDDIFERYTVKHSLCKVKTANMGSLFKLTYNVTLKGADMEKSFIDDLRCRNGNLEISLNRQERELNEL